MWWNVRRHAHGDARSAIDEEVGESGRKNPRLGCLAVVVGGEIDGVLTQPLHHGQGGRSHSALGVTHGGRAGVERTKIAVAIGQWQPHRPRLRQPDQGVIDGSVPMRVQLAHHLSHDTGALDVWTVRTHVHVVHRVEDASLHRFETIACIGQGT